MDAKKGRQEMDAGNVIKKWKREVKKGNGRRKRKGEWGTEMKCEIERKEETE